jgi:hypothetical protein
MIVLHIFILLLGAWLAKVGRTTVSKLSGGGLLVLVLVFGWFFNIGILLTIGIYVTGLGIAFSLQNGKQSALIGSLMIYSGIAIILLKTMLALFKK